MSLGFPLWLEVFKRHSHYKGPVIISPLVLFVILKVITGCSIFLTMKENYQIFCFLLILLMKGELAWLDHHFWKPISSFIWSGWKIFSRINSPYPHHCVRKNGLGVYMPLRHFSSPIGKGMPVYHCFRSGKVLLNGLQF